MEISCSLRTDSDDLDEDYPYVDMKFCEGYDLSDCVLIQIKGMEFEVDVAEFKKFAAALPD